MVSPEFWSGRRVFLTGHTGFKGSWLSLWLHRLGARVTGYALPPNTEPALAHLAHIDEALTKQHLADIRDQARLQQALVAARPEIVFHLAAQPLVGESYRDPVGTYSTNVMGTVNLLEAARTLPDLKAVVVITTDKCYENKENGHAYQEDDPLGGYDPYSSSKAACELVVSSYRRSFLAEAGIAVASARAGNVIGGGDWAEHRLVPDLARAFAAGETARLRNPHAIRPWQHVLEPLAGYLRLAESLCRAPELAGAYNFGPQQADCLTTGALADLACQAWGHDAHWQSEATNFPHEAGQLHLNIQKAEQTLGWRPTWSVQDAVTATLAWYRRQHQGESAAALCREDIARFTQALGEPS